MIKKITRDEAIKMVLEGREVFMSSKMSKDTTILQLLMTEEFIIEVQEEAPTEEVKEVKKEVKKPTKEKKRQPVDHGKICALYRAGWSVKDIANEVKVDPQTVYTHLSKEGLKPIKRKETGNVESDS